MKRKTVFVCAECGAEAGKWQGKCPGCGAWNTLQEQSGAASRPAPQPGHAAAARAVPVTRVSAAEEARFRTGMDELDRVLGGGAVEGSLVLVGGEPGIGKSTLLLQICDSLCRRGRVLYASGEESLQQLKIRANRLGVVSDELFLLAETVLEDIVEAVGEVGPDVLIVDSIQTTVSGACNAAPGGVGQVKECAMALMRLAKSLNITVFVIGHVNKDGAIAGPKVLEHMVDCVLYFEGDRHLSSRILRPAKNRFGSTHEIGVFEMRDTGLAEVPNPSEMLLRGRPRNVPGTCVACVMEGARPILAEVQALVAASGLGTPRRVVSGLDYNRAMLLLAVLEKRAGVFLGNTDVYVNVIGGLKLEEPAADLPMLLAAASSQRDKPLRADIAAFGEVGLTGELRAVSALSQRCAEVFRLGFTVCVVPAQGSRSLAVPEGLEVIRAKTLAEAVTLSLQKN